MSRCGLSSGGETHTALEHAFRADYGRIVAALTRRFGAHRLELIENAVQEAMTRALERWQREGVPTSTEGWLVRVAHNVAFDAIRREERLVGLPEGYDEEEIPAPSLDDELRLMFLSCHPCLSRAAQV